MRRKLLILIGWAISAIFLFLAFRGIRFVELWNSLKAANYWWVIPNVTLVMMNLYYRAYRWQIMLDPVKRVGMRRLFASTMIGFMSNNVLPLRMGEFVRAYSIGKLGDLSRSAAFATIVLERVFDVFTLLLILAVILIGRRVPVNPEGANYDRIVYAGYGMLAMSLLLMALLVFLKIRTEATLRFIGKLLRVLPSTAGSAVEGIFRKFAEGLTVLGDLRRMLRIVVHSVILWVVMALSNYFVFLAFGLNQLPWDASFVVLIVVTLGITLPNAPGYIGVFHGLVVLALSLYPVEVSDTAARACAIVLHGAQYLVITAVGFYYLYREHLSLREAETEALSSDPS